MSKIVKFNQKEKSPAHTLELFLDFSKRGLETAEIVIERSKIAGYAAATAADLDFRKFTISNEMASDFIYAIANFVIVPLCYHYEDEETVYEMIISTHNPESEESMEETVLMKQEDGKIFHFDFTTSEWVEECDPDEEVDKEGIEEGCSYEDSFDYDDEPNPAYYELLESRVPESQLAVEIVGGSGFTWEEYLEIKEENSLYFELFDRVHSFMRPICRDALIGTGKPAELGLIPRDVDCFGLEVGCEDGKLKLFQMIAAEDIGNVDEMLYLDDDEALLMRELYEEEVGSTENVQEMAEILRELADHYHRRETGIIPLSLNTYMKITSFRPLDYEIHSLKDTEVLMTAEEKTLMNKAIAEITAYQL